MRRHPGAAGGGAVPPDGLIPLTGVPNGLYLLRLRQAADGTPLGARRLVVE